MIIEWTQRLLSIPGAPEVCAVICPVITLLGLLVIAFCAGSWLVRGRRKRH